MEKRRHSKLSSLGFLLPSSDLLLPSKSRHAIPTDSLLNPSLLPPIMHGRVCEAGRRRSCSRKPENFAQNPCPSDYITTSSLTSMTETSEPNIDFPFKYKRRKLSSPSEGNPHPIPEEEMHRRNSDSVSVISSKSSDQKVQQVGFQFQFTLGTENDARKPLYICNNNNNNNNNNNVRKEPFISKLLESGGVGVEGGQEGFGRASMEKNLEVGSVDDSCSSSKSNVELVSDSVKTEMDETGECSSSSIMVDLVSEDLTEKEFCIHILRSHGLLEVGGASLAKNSASGESTCSRLCKTCGRLSVSTKMLICDHCEEAYHPSCCNLRLKKLMDDVDEWFCHSCIRNNRKLLKGTKAKNQPSITGEIGRSRTGHGKGEGNPIEMMLRDTDPYTTGVRIGKGFQAEVPDWSGPIESGDDALAKPLELDPSESGILLEKVPRRPSSSICNWLQCQTVVDGTGAASGTVCGKWRRAPLFEVQTDKWECFCAFTWDPSVADCAVPQELETDEVLKQLKYIEMLRPRLLSKQSKLDHAKDGH